MPQLLVSCSRDSQPGHRPEPFLNSPSSMLRTCSPGAVSGRRQSVTSRFKDRGSVKLSIRADASGLVAFRAAWTLKTGTSPCSNCLAARANSCDLVVVVVDATDRTWAGCGQAGVRLTPALARREAVPGHCGATPGGPKLQFES